MTREVSILTPEQVEVKFELAGIGSRCVALILDTLIQALIFLVIGLIFFGLGAAPFFSTGSSGYETILIAIVVMIVFVVSDGYFLYFETTKNGQTPGKKSTGIRVVRDTGHPVDFHCALLRNVMRIVDVLPGTYGVGMISMFVSSKYQRLGDYVAGTLVVKVGRQAQTAPPSPAVQPAEPVPDSTESSLPQEALPFVSAITRDEYRAIKHFMERRAELDVHVARSLSMKLAEPLARKLRMDPAQIMDYPAFLQALGREWERRMIR